MVSSNSQNVNRPAATKREIETNPERPRIKPPCLSNLPDCIRQLDHWVYWTYCWVDGHWTKIPYCVVDGYRPHRLPQFERASHANPETWSGFDDVALNVSVREDGGILGIGFCPHDDAPFSFVDLDNCRNRETGEIADWAKVIVEQLDTYTEISESGTGLKLLLEAKKPGKRCRSKTRPGIEIYDRAHFTALTGNRLPETPADILPRQVELTLLYQEIFPGPEPSEQAVKENVTARPWTPTPDNTDLLLKRARNYVQTIPGAIAGQRGHDQTFHVACVLARDFALPISDAMPIMREWNWTCSPPWPESELLRKLSEADKASGQRGKLRDASSGGEWAAEFASVINLRCEEVPLPLRAQGETAPETQPASMLSHKRLSDLAAFVPLPEPIALLDQADEIDRQYRDHFPCPNRTCPGLYVVDDHTPIELTKRCGRRDCSACCEWRDWRALFVLSQKIALATAAGRAISLLITTTKEWEHDRKQIDYYSPGAAVDGFCRFEWRGGYCVLSTSRIGEQITPDGALAQIKECLVELVPRRHVPDYTASDSWQIPKRPKPEKPKCQFYSMLQPITEEEKDAIADNCDCQKRTKFMPDGELHETVSTTTYRRASWSPDNRKYFWEQRRLGIAFPREEMARCAWEQNHDNGLCKFNEDDIDRPVMEIGLSRRNC